MADALGTVEKIVGVALKIKEAVETVRQNKKDCCDIERCVARVSAVLSWIKSTTETTNPAMSGPLEDLAESMEEALALVTECQEKHIIRRFFGAGDMAKELRRVQDDIGRKLTLGIFATNAQNTMMLTNMQHTAAAAPPPSPPAPPPPNEVIPGFIQFSLSELKAATNDFSDENLVGRGGFAFVYKAELNGQVVAIKKLTLFTNSIERMPDLYNLINIVLDLKHTNIVRPLGYCHNVEMVLVPVDGKYVGAELPNFCFVEEYMPNGSMGSIMKGLGIIGWSSCFQIIQGVAQGLCYLHEQHVVHLDLKPANILLDSDMNPKVGDFGVAKRLDHGDDETTTTNDIAGTVKYMAPEYIIEGIVSTKCDVYAFGITVLEAVSSMCRSKPDGDVQALAGWAWMAREAGRMEQLFDPSLCDDSQLMQIKRCIEVGLMCAQYDRKDRPNMADVVAMLNGEKELPTPKKPAYIFD